MTFPIQRLAAALLFSAAAALPAHAALITFTSTGILTAGSTDELGIFHTGLNLAGKRYTQSMSIDTAFLPSKETTPYNVAAWAVDMPIKFYGTTTVDGHAYTWHIVHDNASVALSRGYHGTEEYEYLDLRGNGSNTFDGYGVDAIAQVESYPPFANALDLTAPRSFDLNSDASWWYFAAVSRQGITSFTGRPDALSWQVTNPVPEPATLGTFMLGLGLAGARLRRRSQRQA